MFYLNQKNNESYSECEEVSRASKIRGAYENKIRFYSPPEKVFEVFSSEKTESGEMRMSYPDFLRAMIPYSYGPLENNAEEYLKNNKPYIIGVVDPNQDGQISFTEFFFFLEILQTPFAIFRKMFRKYPGGKLTKQQFSEELKTLRRKQFKKQQDKV